jgi:hypothetical protein
MMRTTEISPVSIIVLLLYKITGGKLDFGDVIIRSTTSTTRGALPVVRIARARALGFLMKPTTDY